MLGIFIGVAAVIAALILTESVGAFFTNMIEGLGANTVWIEPGSSGNDRAIVTGEPSQSLTVRDVDSLSKLNNVMAISPVVYTQGQVIYGKQNWQTSIQGVSPAYHKIRNWQVTQGFFFNDAEAISAKTVVVLGDTVAKNIFGQAGENPIGKEISLRGQLYRIIGVLAPKGGFNQDDTVLIPFQTAVARLGVGRSAGIEGIQLQTESANHVNTVVEEVKSTLRKNHRLLTGENDDFKITTSDQLMEQSQQISGVITFLLVGIAAISLTVGGIGIMNIMLVSVTQRTREIGLRMSIGARRRDIRNQFLIEALVLCLAGGGSGLLFGLLIGFGMTSAFGMPSIISLTTIISPFVISTAIALVFGIYPASRAARLDPVVALRRAR
jgi:putative ABC transport system permease protein